MITMESINQRLAPALRRLTVPETGEPWLRRAGLVLSLLAVVLLAETAAEATWRWLAPAAATAPAGTRVEAPQAGRENEDRAGESRLRDLVEVPLFGEPPGEPAERARPEVPLEAPETRLDLTLKGVLAVGGEGRGLAIIARGDANDVHAVGAELPGGAELAHVHGDRVILLRDGEYEMLELARDRVAGFEAPEPEPRSRRPEADSATARETTVERRELEALREEIGSDPRRFTEMVRVRPVLGGGGLRGVRISARDDEARGYFEQAGLRDDDIVTAINGIPVSDRSALESLVGELDETSRVRLRVERGGREQELVVRID